MVRVARDYLDPLNNWGTSGWKGSSTKCSILDAIGSTCGTRPSRGLITHVMGKMTSYKLNLLLHRARCFNFRRDHLIQHRTYMRLTTE